MKVGDEEWLKRGTEPKAENFTGWHLTRDGVQISFGEYQVGPGCLGLPGVLVPYDHLRPMLRQEMVSTDKGNPPNRAAPLELILLAA